MSETEKTFIRLADETESDQARSYDPQTLNDILNAVDYLYACQRYKCPCGKGADLLRRVNETLDKIPIDRTNARAFAHGVGATLVALDASADHPRYSFAIILMVEALRRAGDITDDQIEAACARHEQEQVERKARRNAGILGEGLRQVKEQFGRYPVTPGSKSNN